MLSTATMSMVPAPKRVIVETPSATTAAADLRWRGLTFITEVIGTIVCSWPQGLTEKLEVGGLTCLHASITDTE